MNSAFFVPQSHDHVIPLTMKSKIRKFERTAARDKFYT